QRSFRVDRYSKFQVKAYPVVSGQPFNQYDWPVPKTYIRPDEFYTFSNVLIISKQPASFGRNYDWPNTPTPKPIDQFYVFSNINQISRQPASFFNKYDYPNPPRVSWYLDWSLN